MADDYGRVPIKHVCGHLEWHHYEAYIRPQTIVIDMGGKTKKTGETVEGNKARLRATMCRECRRKQEKRDLKAALRAEMGNVSKGFWQRWFGKKG